MYNQNSDNEITKKLPPLMVACKHLNDIKWTFTLITVTIKYCYINSVIMSYYCYTSAYYLGTVSIMPVECYYDVSSIVITMLW